MRPAEADLIRRIRERAGGNPGRAVRVGIGDDCALLRVGAGEELAVTTDLSIVGRHFRLDWHPPESVGHRTLVRGLSDLAAMGARPVAAFLSLALPRELVEKKRGPAGPDPWIERYLDGFFSLADATGTPLAGGDLAESPIFAADIVLLGAVRRGRALLRSTARPGHLIYVTGTLGGAAASLDLLAKSVGSRKKPLQIPRELSDSFAPHLAPQPRLAVGQALVRRQLASAAIDISDGLSTDLAHICEESGVAAEVDAGMLPIHAAATLEQALHGGEDYELLFTAPASTRVPQAIAGVAVTQIGRILRPRAGRPMVTLLAEGGAQALAPRGWQHFA